MHRFPLRPVCSAIGLLLACQSTDQGDGSSEGPGTDSSGTDGSSALGASAGPAGAASTAQGTPELGSSPASGSESAPAQASGESVTQNGGGSANADPETSGEATNHAGTASTPEQATPEQATPEQATPEQAMPTPNATSEDEAREDAGAPAAVDPTTPAEGADAGAAADDSAPLPPRLLVFSKTAGFRHDSIAAGIDALTGLARANDWELVASEDAELFSREQLDAFGVLVFLNTTGDVLNDEQQTAMQEFVRAGGGFVGIHAASDTEFDWPWYGELVGAYFRSHPQIQAATLTLEDPEHPAGRPLPDTWQRTDEWYNFDRNPRDRVNVVLNLRESSYAPGQDAMGDDHPIAWYHEYDGGRAFYTALGHTSESYSEPLFLEHLAGGISWALGR